MKCRLAVMEGPGCFRVGIGQIAFLEWLQSREGLIELEGLDYVGTGKAAVFVWYTACIPSLPRIRIINMAV